LDIALRWKNKNAVVYLKEPSMPSNNSKYTDEMREQTAKLIIEAGRSATSFAEETGIDINTACRWSGIIGIIPAHLF
jgi:transposase-like protein